MARKKKTKMVETANIDTQTSTTKVEGIQDISYAGIVNIKLQHGKKTIMSKKYHNNGMPDLFKFLCLALAGSYTDALRPCKIKLFCYDQAFSQSSAISPATFDWATAFADNSTRPKDASPFVVYDATPIVSRKVKDGITSYDVSFHFRVPGSLISNDVIHMIGLYANNVYIGLEASASAYYLLTERNNEQRLVWSPIELGTDKISGNYSLIIDWTMSITNKEVAATNSATTQNN